MQKIKEIIYIGFAVLVVVGLMAIGILFGIRKNDLALGISFAALSISFAAFFQRFIIDVIFKPILSVELYPNPPDFHKVTVRLNADPTTSFSAYYFAMRVWNHGRVKAEHVRVKLVKVRKKVGDKWETIDQLNPDTLLWRLNGNRDYEPTIHPGTYEHLNIGYIYDPGWRKYVPDEDIPGQEKEPNFSPSRPIFHLQVSTPSLNLPHLLTVGHYLLEIEVSCSNGKKAFKRKFELSFTGWSENESEMLRQWIFIRPLSKKLT